MKKLLSISGLAAAAVLAYAGSASAADMPVKAPPPPPPVYDWSGIYVGFHEGYAWGRLSDSASGGVAGSDLGGSYNANSNVNNGIVGFHFGVQREFTGILGFGGLVLGLEGGLNEPVNRSSLGNFVACANPAFTCGVTNMHENWYGGGRLGLAFNLASGGWLFGGDYLITVSGGYTTAIFQRADVSAAGILNAGGGQSLGFHNGAYVGAGIDHVWAKGPLVDWITGIDWQHEFFNGRTDLDANGVGHNLSADVDIVRLRTTLKFH
jgi:outer membrane immunogenic protein